MALTNTGLIARYYFDEAISGTGPATVEDYSGNAYDLTTVNYGAGNMAYTDANGNRGLDSTSVTGTQRAVRAIDNTTDALRDALDGVQKATIEVVVQLTAGQDNSGRIFGVNNRAGGNGDFILKAHTTGLTDISVGVNNNNYFHGGGGIGTTRCVVHIVLDSTQATAADRLRLSINGGAFSAFPAGITLNETIALGTDLDLICLNRESGGSFDRSIDGVLHYAAIYAHAFSQTECEDSHDVLIADDDTPWVPETNSNRTIIYNQGMRW